MESSMHVTELDIEWIHPWIGLDCVRKNGPMCNSGMPVITIQ